jgi:proteasome assembly chaperone (PAC2) family protein
VKSWQRGLGAEQFPHKLQIPDKSSTGNLNGSCVYCEKIETRQLPVNGIDLLKEVPMPDSVELWEQPKADKMYMIAGWRQWADGGAVSSGLPEYLVELLNAREIGQIRPEGFYMFQFPGTHDLVRPVIRFKDGYPEALDVPENQIFYAEIDQHGLVILIGDEPQLDMERYAQSVLQIAQQLHVRRIVGLGGVYGEFPFDKERSISGSYSLLPMKKEMKRLAVQLTDYQGGASVGSYICRRAGERNMEYVGLYAFVPMFDFSGATQINHRLQIENDYMAWLAVLRRVNYMLKIDVDLSDLTEKSAEEIKELDLKMEELEKLAPQLELRDYFQRITDEFTEVPFIPLDDVWEENVRRILDKLNDEEDPTE